MATKNENISNSTSRNLTLTEKAIKLMEIQAFHGMEDYCPGIKALQDENNKSIEKQIYMKFAKIYSYFHSIDKDHSCHHVHEDMREEIEKDFENIEKFEKGEL